jgi:hypothetical protein
LKIIALGSHILRRKKAVLPLGCHTGHKRSLKFKCRLFSWLSVNQAGPQLQDRQRNLCGIESTF